MTSEGPARRVRTGRAFVALGVGCAVAALGVVAYAAWELWGTNGHEANAQAELRAAYEAVTTSSTTTAAPNGEEPASGPTTTEAVAEVELLPGGVEARMMAARFPDDSDALAVIEVPGIDLFKFVMRDVSVESLRSGPGHYRGTVRPGVEGNSAIAGHRTTYGAPFGRVDELEPGDEIVVSSKDGRFTYEVMDPRTAYAGYEDEIDEFGTGYVVVDPDDTWIVGDFGDTRLTLTSCHPELTSRNRIVVTARLVSEGLERPVLFPKLDPELLDELVSEDLSVLEAD